MEKEIKVEETVDSYPMQRAERLMLRASERDENVEHAETLPPTPHTPRGR